MRVSPGSGAALWLSLAFVTIAAVYVYGEHARTTRLLHQQLEMRAGSMAVAVRAAIESTNDPLLRRRAVNAFGAEPDVQMLAVVRDSGLQVVAATRHAMVGHTLSSLVETDLLAQVRDALASGRSRAGYRRDLHTAFAVEPVPLAADDEHAEPAVVAVLLDTRNAEAGVLASMFTDMARFAVVLAVVALLATVLLWKRVVRPLHELRTAIMQRAAGDTTARVAAAGSGELATLGRAFNAMLEQIGLEQERGRSTAELLRSSERLLDIALSGAGIGLWGLDLGNGELQVDERWLAICGRQAGSVPLDEVGEEALVHPEDLARLRAARAAHINADQSDYECELRVASGDGGWRWVLDRGRVVEWGDDGEPLRMAGTRQDVDERKCAQLAVADSERLLSTVLDNMPMPVFLKRRDGRFLLVNDYYLRCYDVHLEDLLEQTALHAHGAPFGRQYMREDAEVMRARHALRWDSRERIADGSIRDFSVTKFPVFDANGEIIAIGGITIDETERLQAMAGIRASERRLRSLTANLPGAVYRAAAVPGGDWRMSYASEGIETMLGMPRAELLDTSASLHARVHEDDHDRVLAGLHARAAQDTDFDIEYRLWVTPQDMRWVNDRGRFSRDADSGVVTIDGLLLDITARKQAESELTRQRTLFEALFNSVPDAMCITDQSRRVLLLNPGFEQVLGYSNDDLRGRSTGEFYAEAAVWEEQGRRQFNVHAGRTTTPDIVHYRCRDGRTFPGETVSSPILDAGGELLGFVGITRDVSERQRAERDLREARDCALEAARAKADFLANMSHELRTPMNGVLGMLDLLHETPLDADQAECVEVARRSGEALMKLIAEVLDFSRLDSGQPQIENVEFNLWECVDDVLRLVAERAQQNGVELVARYSSSVPRIVRGDARWLRQVLVNLIGNAVKFTRDGEVLVSVTHADGEDDAGERLLFEVRDSGIGIDADHQQRIFNAFEQADSSATRRYGGTGLGLAICRALVERMGGSIGVESAPGMGSRFHFDACFIGVAPGLLPGRCVADLGGRTVLLAVHHRPRAEALAQIVAGIGARAVICDAQDDLVRLLDTARQADRPFDLVLSDVRCAGGVELERLCQLRAGASGHCTDVLLLTALGQRLDEAVLTAAGVTASLIEPVRTAKLVESLGRLLGEALATGAVGEKSALPVVPPASVAAVAVLDERLLDDMCGTLGKETVREIVDTFLLGVEAFAPQLRDCVERDDPSSAAACLHRMVGSAAALGATRLAAVCRAHERRLRIAEPAPACAGIDLAAIDELLHATRLAVRERFPEALAATG